MKIIVSARHFDLTQPLKDFAHEKLEHLKKYFDQVIEVDLVLRVTEGASKENQVAEATLWANGAVLHAEAKAIDMYASIQAVVDKLEKQLKRYKQKLRDNRHRRTKGGKGARAEGKEGAAATHSVFQVDHEAEEEAVNIVRESDFVLQPLTVEEASLQLQELNQNFVVFSNIETNALGVVYKRPDGAIGWIEAKSGAR